MSKIDRVEIHEFSFEVRNLGVRPTAAGVAGMSYVSGGRLKTKRYAIRIRTNDGLQGEYITHWVGTPASLGQTRMLAPRLIGRDPEQRELIYDDLKHAIKAYDQHGSGSTRYRHLGPRGQHVQRFGIESCLVDSAAAFLPMLYGRA